MGSPAWNRRHDPPQWEERRQLRRRAVIDSYLPVGREESTSAEQVGLPSSSSRIETRGDGRPLDGSDLVRVVDDETSGLELEDRGPGTGEGSHDPKGKGKQL